eukprot:7095136-Pyramimonas_sp.AAC.1
MGGGPACTGLRRCWMAGKAALPAAEPAPPPPLPPSSSSVGGPSPPLPIGSSATRRYSCSSTGAASLGKT